MIVVLLVVGLVVAVCIAGWIPTIRQALRVDVVLPGPAPRVADEIEPAPVPAVTG